LGRDVLNADDALNASYAAKPALGRFLGERMFAPGRSLPCNELTRHATGEPLSAAAFAAEFGE
jgi:hypothetical protein